ncbi:PREDICTED: LOW QUALITY PROTEIN: uncharacterized protein LOC104780192 [Camelina sativa]|uniref:LOW QUALITY PROTEIN: uncharacterized protein LOC104780192 n=1 Tax=Camelina sativa TaxID=90675 RepID=A0ABM0YMN4_CAMSA|nr:PREDICTED: LOW QUALITY PROTEIN: uncharacterized protein LOC104780192 [Camelina sativa]
MDPQMQNTWSPRVQNAEKGGVVSDLELAVGGVIEEEEEEVLVSPSGKDMNSSRAQHNVKENRKNGVTSSDDDRITFYALATIIVINNLVVSILVLWFDIFPDAGTFHKLLYVLLAAATIPYIGVLFIICLCNDVPVPSYRLGAERRFGIYVATMVVTYCISYGVKDIDVMIEMSGLVTTSVTGSWTALFGTLYYFISAISLVNSHCLAADLSEQQQRERQRQRRQQPLLPVSSSSSSTPPCAFLL